MKTLAFVGAVYGILKGNVLQKRTLSKEIWPNVARQCALCGRERYQWQFGQVFLQKCLLLKECAYGVVFKKYYACKTEFVVGNESCFTGKTCC